VKLSRIAPSLLLLILACGGEPEECNTFAECDRLLASARIDGRPLSVALDADERNGLIRVESPVVTVQMIAFRPSLGGGEGVHLWLDGFHGVGAYPVVEDYLPGNAMAGYWQESDFDPTSCWGRESQGDTVWVTAYDSLAGTIEGNFQLTCVRVGDEIEVTDGGFRGTIRDRAPSGSGAAAGRVLAGAPLR
jgi:hypothetical protein